MTNTKKQQQQNEQDETQHDHILVKVECDKFVEYVNEFGCCGNGGVNDKTMSELIKHVKSIKKNAQETQVTFLVPGFKQYFK